MNIKDTIESVRKQFRTDSDPFPDDNDKIDSLVTSSDETER